MEWLISFSCFGVRKLITSALKGQWGDPQNKKGFTGGGQAIDILSCFFPLLIFSDCFLLVLHLARVSFTTGGMRQYLNYLCNLCRMAHQYVPLPIGLVCLPAQPQELGGDYRRKTVILGEQGHRRSLIIFSFVQGGTGWVLTDLYKLTSSRQNSEVLVWTIGQQSVTDFMRVAWEPQVH